MVYLRELKEAEISKLYEGEGAIWRYDGGSDSRAPHAASTSGFCTDSYVNSDLVMRDPVNVQLLAFNLIVRLQARGRILPVDWIIGSAYGAIAFSYEVARQLGVRHGIVKRDPSNPTGLRWDGMIGAGKTVLRVEELVTTAGTAAKMEQAVLASNAPVRFLPDVATVFWRPPIGSSTAGLIDIIPLVREGMMTWPRQDCPLCKRGSPRLRPKQNWGQFAPIGR